LSPDGEEKRQTARYGLGRLAAMFIGDDAVPHYCVVSDFSESGVRINANGHKIPDQFVLVFTSSLPHKNGTYKVVWRNGNIVGAEFLGAHGPTHLMIFARVRLIPTKHLLRPVANDESCRAGFAAWPSGAGHA
jgi:hypothetical protein